MLGKVRKAFREKFRAGYPRYARAAGRAKAGVLYRFVHKMQVGDLVIYPSMTDKLVRLGRVIGPYKYKPKLNRKHPHVRKVEWIRVVPRKKLSPAAKLAIGRRLSLYQPHEGADELRAILLPRSAS